MNPITITNYIRDHSFSSYSYERKVDEISLFYTSTETDDIKIQIDDEMCIILPGTLVALKKTIVKSKYIYDLQDDWDGDDSPGYSKETWFKAITFLIDYAKWLYNTFGKIMYIPNILNGPNSGIDILWEYDNFRMLLYIDKDGKKGNFYSDRPKNQETEGDFHVESISYKHLPLPIEL